MAILVTGSTGTVGSLVVDHLARGGATVRALTRAPDTARFPEGVTPVRGDMTDVDSVRAALEGVRTLFLLNAVTPDEVTQAMLALALARDAGIERFVYLSVIHSDLFADVPHFAGKYAVERMIGQLGLPATILRPAYYMQNDATLRDALLGYGVYPMPVGGSGTAMVDVRDLAKIAALHLLRRHEAASPLPAETMNVVGPDLLTGGGLAATWSAVLERPIHYAGDDLIGFEQQFRSFAPGWMALDMRLMMNRIQRYGMIPAAGDVERLAAQLGRPLRSYRDFTTEAARQWAEGSETDIQEKARLSPGEAAS